MAATMATVSRIAAVFCVAGSALFAFAQQQRPEIPRLSGETVDVSIVNIDVVVTEKSGKRVTGLTKNDFQIVEDGRPQPISNFAEYRDDNEVSIGASSVEASGSTAAPAPPRALIVFVDPFSMPAFKAEPVFSALRTSLHSLVRPQDTVLVARWRQRLIIEQPFTNDLARIDAAIDRAAKASNGPEVDRMTQLRVDQSELIDFLKTIADNTRTTFTADSSDMTQMFNIESLAQVEKWDLVEKVKAINALMSALPPQSKKAMILLASRMSAFAGAEGFYVTNQGTLSNEFRDRFNTRELIQSMIDTAAARGVTIYPMFPEGLKNRPDNPTEVNGYRASQMQNFGTSNYQVLQNELGPLQEIAAGTGGTMQWSSLEVAKALPALHEDLDSYYSLAYRVPARRDNKRHRVTVRATNSAYVVRTRGEVVERSESAAMHDRVVATLYTDALAQEIPIDVQFGQARRQSKLRFVIPVLVNVPVSRMLTVAEGGAKKGAFTVYVARAHAVGSVGDVTKQTVPFTIPPDKASIETFTYTFDLLTDFYTTRVVVAFVDEVSHATGFARIDLAPEHLVNAK